MPLDLSYISILSRRGANNSYLGINQEKIGVARDISAPSPIGGLNTKDSQSAMESTDAIIMENWFPSQGYVETRKGYEEYLSGIDGYAETLIEFNANNIRKFICCNSDQINDVTNPESIVNLGSGYANARWQSVNFNAYLIMVNGTDTPKTFDGTTLADSTISGSGLIPSQLDGINVFKNRVYVWNSNQQDVWYGSTNAIGGSFTKFQLSRVAPSGGNLISMMTWNLDGGDGVDDYAVFLMSNGDVLLYQGSDPSSWALVGTYKIGRPISIRGALKVAGDIVIITENDFVFFSEVFKNQGSITQSGKLSGAALEAVQNYGSNYGWEVKLYPKGAWLLFNVPVATNSEYIQYVVNTITGAATKFTNMNASTWGLFNGELFFGVQGKIFKADSGFSDDGGFINCDCQAAYSKLGSNNKKTINSYRNLIKADGSVEINSIVNFDFGNEVTSSNSSALSSGVEWDTAFWDTVFWSPEAKIRGDIIIARGQGLDVGMRLKISISGQQVRWYRTDFNLTDNKGI